MSKIKPKYVDMDGFTPINDTDIVPKKYVDERSPFIINSGEIPSIVDVTLTYNGDIGALVPSITTFDEEHLYRFTMESSYYAQASFFVVGDIVNDPNNVILYMPNGGSVGGEEIFKVGFLYSFKSHLGTYGPYKTDDGFKQYQIINGNVLSNLLIGNNVSNLEVPDLSFNENSITYSLDDMTDATEATSLDMPFVFVLKQQPISSISMLSDAITFNYNSDMIFELYLTSTPSSYSPIKYKIFGTFPNRHITISYTNVLLSGETDVYLNFQIKIFEKTQHIEIHLGSFTFANTENIVYYFIESGSFQFFTSLSELSSLAQNSAISINQDFINRTVDNNTCLSENTVTNDLFVNNNIYKWDSTTNQYNPFSSGGSLPTGGTAGQILSKNSATNYDTIWVDKPEASVGITRVAQYTTSSSLTPNVDSYDFYVITALSSALTVNTPSGSPITGQKLLIRIKDNGTQRIITWNASFRAIGLDLPTTTTISKTIYIGCLYNETDSKWDVLAVGTEE